VLAAQRELSTGRPDYSSPVPVSGLSGGVQRVPRWWAAITEPANATKLVEPWRGGALPSRPGCLHPRGRWPAEDSAGGRRGHAAGRTGQRLRPRVKCRPPTSVGHQLGPGRNVEGAVRDRPRRLTVHGVHPGIVRKGGTHLLKRDPMVGLLHLALRNFATYGGQQP